MPRSIAVKLLQHKLHEHGALQSPETGYHNEQWKPDELYSKNLRRNMLEDKDSGSLAWLVRSFMDENQLVAQMRSEDKKESAIATILLGMLGKKEAMEKLISLVGEKSEIKAGEVKTVPFWKPAIAVLGWNKCAEAVPLLEKILESPDSDQAALVLAVNALGNIGDKNSAVAIRKMLGRNDLPCVQIFQKSESVGNMQATQEDSRWKIELTAAANLAKLGQSFRDIIEKHLNDERILVRRHARKIMKQAPR
jgi:HEAT repeat protein